MHLIAQGPEDAINWNEVVDLEKREAVFAGRNRLRVLFSAVASGE
jgi:hypothetical protein